MAHPTSVALGGPNLGGFLLSPPKPPEGPGARAHCSCCPAPPGGLLCAGTSAAPSRLALQSGALVPLSVRSRSSKKEKGDTGWENLGSPDFRSGGVGMPRADRVGVPGANSSLLRSGQLFHTVPHLSQEHQTWDARRSVWKPGTLSGYHVNLSPLHPEANAHLKEPYQLS